MHKNRFRRAEGGERERLQRTRGGECDFLKLSYHMAFRFTRAEKEQRPGGHDVCLIKNETLAEVSANKQTIGIIRCPTAIHIFKWGGRFRFAHHYSKEMCTFTKYNPLPG